MPHTNEHQSCIDACNASAQSCEQCSDACIEENRVESARLTRDCAEICWMASSYMSRESDYMYAICDICADICEECAEECEKYDTEHHRACAKACRICADECRRMVEAVAEEASV